MLLIKFFLSLVFPFLIVSTRLRPSGAPARRWSFLKGLNAPDSAAHSRPGLTAADASNSPSNAPLDQGPPANQGATTNQGDQNSANPNVTAAPPPDAIVTCYSPSGKKQIYSVRDCWQAAKIIAENSTSTAQCGVCVLGLFDVEKKETFKPPGPIEAKIIQDQAMKLLDQCRKPSKKPSKRENPPSSDVNVQLLLKYGREPYSCAGL